MNPKYLKSTVFGFQDALVSTTGVIAGVSAGTLHKETVILAGVVTIVVEALSMSIGEYTSQKAADEKSNSLEKDVLYKSTLLMGSSYFFGGLIPLIPVTIFELPLSSYLSVLFALIGLFILGFIKAKIVRVNPITSAFEILILGGFATFVGFFVGTVFRV